MKTIKVLDKKFEFQPAMLRDEKLIKALLECGVLKEVKESNYKYTDIDNSIVEHQKDLAANLRSVDETLTEMKSNKLYLAIAYKVLDNEGYRFQGQAKTDSLDKTMYCKLFKNIGAGTKETLNDYLEKCKIGQFKGVEYVEVEIKRLIDSVREN